MEYVVKCKKGFLINEEIWGRLVERYAETGKMIRPNDLLEMFPEQFPNGREKPPVGD